MCPKVNLYEDIGILKLLAELLNFQQSALESCLKWYISPMET
jgi:hypothetical protein